MDSLHGLPKRLSLCWYDQFCRNLRWNKLTFSTSSSVGSLIWLLKFFLIDAIIILILFVVSTKSLCIVIYRMYVLHFLDQRVFRCYKSSIKVAFRIFLLLIMLFLCRYQRTCHIKGHSYFFDRLKGVRHAWFLVSEGDLALLDYDIIAHYFLSLLLDTFDVHLILLFI